MKRFSRDVDAWAARQPLRIGKRFLKQLFKKFFRVKYESREFFLRLDFELIQKKVPKISIRYETMDCALQKITTVEKSL